jgi:hypothetical protein
VGLFLHVLGVDAGFGPDEQVPQVGFALFYHVCERDGRCVAVAGCQSGGD